MHAKKNRVARHGSDVSHFLRGSICIHLSEVPAYTLDRHDIYFYGNKVKKRRFFQRMSTMGAYWITER